MSRDRANLGPDQNPRQGISTWNGPNRTNATGAPMSRREPNRYTPARTTNFEPNYGSSSSPFTVMRHIAEDMDRMLADFSIGRNRSLFSQHGPAVGVDLWRESGTSLWEPQIEMFRRGDKIVIRADLPGMTKENVQVKVEGDVLTISGERMDERDEQLEGMYHSERSYGQFFRTIALPAGVNADRCDASFKDGVLEVQLDAPKESNEKGKEIPIK